MRFVHSSCIILHDVHGNIDQFISIFHWKASFLEEWLHILNLNLLFQEFNCFFIGWPHWFSFFSLEPLVNLLEETGFDCSIFNGYWENHTINKKTFQFAGFYVLFDFNSSVSHNFFELFFGFEICQLEDSTCSSSSFPTNVWMKIFLFCLRLSKLVKKKMPVSLAYIKILFSSLSNEFLLL